MAGFVAIGAVGLGLLLLTLVLDDMLDGLFDSFGGLMSGPAVGAFLAAFGFGGALVLSRPDTSVPAATGGGVVAGLVVGGIAGLFVRAIKNMPTDETPSSAGMLGVEAIVVTAIGPDRAGEVLVRLGGSPYKMTARSPEPVAAGQPVTVTAVTSPTSVVVEPA